MNLKRKYEDQTATYVPNCHTVYTFIIFNVETHMLYYILYILTLYLHMFCF